MMFQNPNTDEIRDILKRSKTIAVVGLSDNPNRDSYAVAQQMQRHGYRIIPVNPTIGEVLGEKSYPSLADIPDDVEIDIIDIFRRSDALKAVVEEAVKTDAPVIWAQEGVYDEEAAKIAADHGKTMVMDRCIKVMHSLYAR
ncbi:CoA-binding protein [Alicyclobacillus sp. ALC3]|uniref:CoA-binding protein n=1 Tax=Alicyclobacillus sp. ALC3 TaxID=2796143 RepID=UPI00237848E7|nr:CoA-binding protein [Alicyclobacillus sp. ALC3]WDL99311.1 CoA-binding protein [Alicyclobacillus sp. ALC3]